MKKPRLDHPLTLEAPVVTPDGSGGFDTFWMPRGTLWGALAPSRGGERAGGSAAISQVPYEITIRAAPHGSEARPTASDRFRYGSRSFRITSVREADARGLYLICSTIEEVIT